MESKPDKEVAGEARSTLFFGGSFNPIHHGHLICARAVAEARGYRRVALVPTGQPPHKPISPDLASGADRLEMCHLAISQSPLFEVNSIELSRPGPSYTIDTIRALALAAPGPVHWLIGADMLLYLPKWHRATELLQEVQFVVMARPGWTLDWTLLPPEFRGLKDNIVQAPMIDISATDIRRRVAAGASIEYLTPPAVQNYIHSRGLYRQISIT
jgi:nicotinate-nucleotide adenylyltransferase